MDSCDDDTGGAVFQLFLQNSSTFVPVGSSFFKAIDPYPPGHNPHAHILLTVRPLDEKGKWQYKTEKEYLCVKNGKEQGFTAAEFKQAQADGWEKQYQYKVGKKKVYMVPSSAQAQGYERVSKYPKSTKYGRQNPISERWNSEEQLVFWRKAWADVTNLHLERAGQEGRIDYRGHAERELEEQPTIHEGVIARALEKKGIDPDSAGESGIHRQHAVLGPGDSDDLLRHHRRHHLCGGLQCGRRHSGRTPGASGDPGRPDGAGRRPGGNHRRA